MLLSGYQTAIQIAALGGFWAAFAAHSVLSDLSSLQWQIPVTIQLLPGVLLLLGTLAIPESPRFLAEESLISDAIEAVAWLRALPIEHEQVQEECEELEELSATTHFVQAHQPTFVQQLQGRNVQNRLGVGIGLMIAQNMVGLNALNYCRSLISSISQPHKVSNFQKLFVLKAVSVILI
jgi:hypothetical protein